MHCAPACGARRTCYSVNVSPPTQPRYLYTRLQYKTDTCNSWQFSQTTPSKAIAAKQPLTHVLPEPERRSLRSIWTDNRKLCIPALWSWSFSWRLLSYCFTSLYSSRSYKCIITRTCSATLISSSILSACCQRLARSYRVLRAQVFSVRWTASKPPPVSRLISRSTLHFFPLFNQLQQLFPIQILLIFLRFALPPNSIYLKLEIYKVYISTLQTSNLAVLLIFPPAFSISSIRKVPSMKLKGG